MVLDLPKLSFKSERELNTVPDKQNLRICLILCNVVKFHCEISHNCWTVIWEFPNFVMNTSWTYLYTYLYIFGSGLYKIDSLMSNDLEVKSVKDLIPLIPSLYAWGVLRPGRRQRWKILWKQSINLGNLEHVGSEGNITCSEVLSLSVLVRDINLTPSL